MIYLNKISSCFSDLSIGISNRFATAYSDMQSQWEAISAICMKSFQDLSEWISSPEKIKHSFVSLFYLTPKEQANRLDQTQLMTYQKVIGLIRDTVFSTTSFSGASVQLDEIGAQVEKERIWIEKLSHSIEEADWKRCPTVTNSCDGVVVKERVGSFAPVIVLKDTGDNASSENIPVLVLIEWALNLKLEMDFLDFPQIKEALEKARSKCDASEMDCSFSLVNAADLNGKVMRRVQIDEKNETSILLCPLIGIAQNQNGGNLIDLWYNPISFNAFTKAFPCLNQDVLGFNVSDSSKFAFYAVILKNPNEKKIRVNFVLELHQGDDVAIFDDLKGLSITGFIQLFEKLEDPKVFSFMKQMFQTGT